MQPTMMEMIVEERQRELDRKRHQALYDRDLKLAHKPRRNFLARLMKSTEMFNR